MENAQVEEKKQDEVLTDTELADFLKLKRRTIVRWRAKGVGPPFVLTDSGNIRYLRSSVMKWLHEREFDI